MKTTEKMAVTMAMFHDQQFDLSAAFQRYGTDENWTPTASYVRVSEWLAVEFKPLPAALMAGAQMTALTALRDKTVTEFREKLEYIDGKIENLRALTGPVLA